MQKKVLTFVLVLFCCSVGFAQHITYDKSKIQSIIRADKNPNAIIESVSKYCVTPSVRTFGGGSMSADSPCIEIKIKNLVDSNGTIYYRLLYIPIKLVGKNNFSDNDWCYYEDHCVSGPHFDTQGGKYHAYSTIQKILQFIKIKR